MTDKAVAEAEECHHIAKQEACDNAERLEMKESIDQTAKLIDELESKMIAYIQADLLSICNKTRLEKFLVTGSWSSAMIAKVFNEWDRCEELHDFDRWIWLQMI